MNKNLLIASIIILLPTKVLSQYFAEADTIVAKKYLDKGYKFSISYQKDSSLFFYEKAAQVYEKAEKWDKYFECLNRISRLYLMFGDYESSIKICDEVILKSKRIIGHDNIPQANAYLNRALVKYEKGLYKDALQLSHKALGIQRKIIRNENSDISGIYNIIGLINKDLGSYELSLEYFKKSLNITRRLIGEETSNAANIYNNLGLTYGLKNDYLQAIKNHKKALNIRVRLFGENHVQVGNSYNNLALVYSYIKDIKSALDMYHKAAIIYEESLGKNHNYTRIVINNIGFAYSQINKYDSALKYHLKALQYQESKGGLNAASLNTGYKTVADSYEKLNEFHKSLWYYQKSLIANVSSFNDTTIRSNPTIDNAQDPLGLVLSLNNKAWTLNRYYLSTGNLSLLELSYNTYFYTDSALTALKSSYLNRSDKLGIEVNTHEDAINVCMELFQQTKNDKYLKDAFFYAEKNKAGILLESFNTLSAKKIDLIPDTLIKLEQKLKENQTLYKSKIVKLESVNDNSNMVNINEDSLFQFKRRHDSLVLIFEKNYPLYHKLRYKNNILSIEELQQQIPKNTAVLEYFEGDSILYVFAITPSSFNVSSVESPITINRKIDQLREVTNQWSQGNQTDKVYLEFIASASFLYTNLVKQSIDNLSKGEVIENLVIIPDGKLSYVPYEILLADNVNKKIGDYSSLNYLIKDYSISYAYSATLNYQEVTNHDRIWPSNNSYIGFAPTYHEINEDSAKLLALGKFRNTISNLKWNQIEVETASQFMKGDYRLADHATESEFKHQVGKYNIIHLAMHALIDDEDPMLSKLVFTKNETDSLNDGYLNTYEIFNIGMNPELVVLSACNTGVGELQKGEGMMSLAYAFAYAGCPSIIMSQWQVDDKSTGILMQHFYKNLAKGMNKSSALRNAKLEFLKDPSSRYTNPSYWGGFVLIGNTEPIELKESNNLLIAILSLLGIVVILGIYFKYLH